MDPHHIIASFATAAVVGMAALSAAPLGPSPQLPSAQPPSLRPPTPTSPSPSREPGAHGATDRPACAGVSDCRIVASVDVDGDARADQVGWRQLSDRSIQIRVHTARAAIVTATVDVQLWWGGGAWGGASSVDGIPGAELLVGSAQGAHTPMYTMLTYRPDGLRVERSPSPLSPLWLVDAAYGDYIGWRRHHLPDGHVAMTQRIAFRTEGTNRFKGRDVTYVWSVDHWVRTTTAPTSYSTVRSASGVGGFHVAGLEAFPGTG